MFVIDRGSPALVESQGSQESRWAAASNSLWTVNPHVIPLSPPTDTSAVSFLWQGERGPLGETGFPGPEGPQGVAVRMLHEFFCSFLFNHLLDVAKSPFSDVQAGNRAWNNTLITHYMSRFIHGCLFYRGEKEHDSRTIWTIYIC